MKRAPESTMLFLAVTLIAAAGCAAGHPATEDSEPGAVTTSDTLVGALVSNETTRQVCTPSATRECKTFWTDGRGQLHCTVLAQVCRSDGFAWQACGDLDAGPTPDTDADASAD